MATASVTNTFAPLTDILSSEANTNFQDLVSFLNSQVIHKDGSVAATAHLSGPLVDPVAAGQYANKQYVDRLGIVAQQTLTANSVNWTTDADTDMTLLNVPVVANRTYEIHLRAPWTNVNAGEWSIECKINGVVHDRFDWISTSATTNGHTDAGVYWTPMVTASTDDLLVHVNEISGASTFHFNASSTTRRQLTLIDLGVL